MLRNRQALSAKTQCIALRVTLPTRLELTNAAKVFASDVSHAVYGSKTSRVTRGSQQSYSSATDVNQSEMLIHAILFASWTTLGEIHVLSVSQKKGAATLRT